MAAMKTNGARVMSRCRYCKTCYSYFLLKFPFFIQANSPENSFLYKYLLYTLIFSTVSINKVKCVYGWVKGCTLSRLWYVCPYLVIRIRLKEHFVSIRKQTE